MRIYPNIALSGKAGSGKDTVAAHLVAAHGYTRLAFADPLKEMALEIDPIIDDGNAGYRFHGARLSEVVRAVGWDRAKSEYPEVRRILQHVGQTIRAHDADFWVLLLLRRAAKLSRPIVVTDMRYRNEYTSLARGGMALIRVTRTGAGLPGDAGKHESETALDGRYFDAHLDNDGSLSDLHAKIDGLLAG